MTEHKIGWLNMPGFKPETWNPIVGCSKVSPGCDNCYAEKMAKRIVGMLEKNKGETYHSYLWVKDWNGRTALNTDQIDKPLQWQAPRMIFVCSMGDLFHESNHFKMIDQVFDIIQRCPQHIFIILTKRPEKMSRYYQIFHKNVWLGVTAENQEQANKRIPILLQIPAAKRFVSIEPMLGPVEIKDYLRYDCDCGICNFCNGQKVENIDWVICGGESGSKARPMHYEWVRSLRDQCKAIDVPFFFKQWGEWIPANEMPEEWGHFADVKGTHSWVNQSDGKDTCIGPGVMTINVGRNKAGNLLDNQQHHEWPKFETRNSKPANL